MLYTVRKVNKSQHELIWQDGHEVKSIKSQSPVSCIKAVLEMTNPEKQVYFIEVEDMR